MCARWCRAAARDLDGLRLGLIGLLKGFSRLHPQLALQDIDLTELSHLLEADQVTPVAMGLHGRRLHQVRVFGNWMGHPSPPNRRQAVSTVDVATMLAALHRVLESYPWN